MLLYNVYRFVAVMYTWLAVMTLVWPSNNLMLFYILHLEGKLKMKVHSKSYGDQQASALMSHQDCSHMHQKEIIFFSIPGI